MFRKLVANLSFSPTLIGELGFYAKQLKREESIRGLGLFIATLALLAQAMTVLYPPESANTAHANDLLYGGVASKADLLKKYDTNERNLQDIYTSLGIERSDILLAQSGKLPSRHSGHMAGRNSQLSPQEGELAHEFQKAAGGTGTIYLAPIGTLGAWVASSPYKSHDALIGQSAKSGRFAIVLASGNPVLSTLPKSLSTETTCRDTAKECTSVHYTKSATNSTKNQLAGLAPAAASDRITYTLRAKNIGDTPTTASLTDQLDDVLEYADIVDTGGGIFDQTTATLSWRDTPLEAGQSISRSFSVRVKPHVPATTQGSSNLLSYDCTMTNSQSNTISIQVACPLPKYVELLASELPPTSMSSSLIVSSSVFVVIVYLYFRARQQREELRLIRKDINSGTI